MSKKEEVQQSPKLTVPQVIEYCKNDLGITFNLMDEEKAKNFLQKHNYFFRLKQYCSTCSERTKSGKYVGLDFGHLVELSTIDMFFFFLLLKMTIDLEHYLKVKLVNDCQNNPADDGYEVVQAFLQRDRTVKNELQKGSWLAGYGGIDFEKYLAAPAVWNFLEMINFFTFTNFFAFYYEFFRSESEYTKRFDSIRRIRNACAHNVCMLCSFKPVQNFKNDIEENFELLQAKVGGSPGTVSSCMKVPLLNDFAVMLSIYTKLVTSPQVKELTLKEVADFFDGRMVYRKHYFEQMPDIKNAYKFARSVLEYYSSKAKE